MTGEAGMPAAPDRTVTPADFEGIPPLAGVQYPKKLESLAWQDSVRFTEILRRDWRRNSLVEVILSQSRRLPPL